MRNIGMLQEADIDVSGLVVIAGENDTGKSTIGKLIYSIVRAFSKYEDEFEEDRLKSLLNLAEEIYFKIRSEVDFKENPTLRSSFGIEFFDEITNAEKLENMIIIIEDKRQLLNSVELDEEIKTWIDKKFIEMIEIVHLNLEDNLVKQQALNKVLSSEFDGQIKNKFLDGEAKVTGYEGSNQLFSFKLNDEETINFQYNDQLYFTEVIYLESPYVLQFKNQSSAYRTSSRGLFLPPVRQKVQSVFPLHIYDLFSIMNQRPIVDYSLTDVVNQKVDVRKKINQLISEIIGGNFSFNQEKKEFLYKRNVSSQSVDVKLNNIATGIKSFGILQLLTQVIPTPSRSILTIDEPEVHLHPNWQIKYAQLLVLLVKELDITIIVNSHSPYFIEAMKVYSDKYNLDKKTKFYLTEKNESNYSSTVKNVTNELEVIFEKLTEPFMDLESLILGDEDDDDN
ncbi:AAA family ATPase [Radiobacillus sp. PE A8.2]|uniref:AAA family ATPase n=1 Tax=Radiobacillus sp. PE A8.2 TaxID=3380349 RepID=UPI003890A953